MDAAGNTTTIPEARLYGKMAKVMSLVNRVPKAGQNTFHNYRYASADDVADTIRGAMAETNIALIVQMGEVKQERIEYQSSNKTTSIMRTTVNFNFIFACGDTGAIVISPWTSQVDDNSDKAINKCATSAEKYFLMKTFIVSAGDEPDSDGDKHTESTPRKITPSSEKQSERWNTIEALKELAQRSYTAGLIEVGADGDWRGVEEMEALIAPRIWNDFETRNAAALAVKEAAEKRQLSQSQQDALPVRSGTVNVTDATIEDRTAVFTTKAGMLTITIKQLTDMLQPNGDARDNKKRERWLESVNPGLWQHGASVTFPELRLWFTTLKEQNNALKITSIDVAADMPANGAAKPGDATFPSADVELPPVANADTAANGATTQLSFGIAPGQTSFVPPSRQGSARVDLTPKGRL
jgi:ERF superfamily protein